MWQKKLFICSEMRCTKTLINKMERAKKCFCVQSVIIMKQIKWETLFELFKVRSCYFISFVD